MYGRNVFSCRNVNLYERGMKVWFGNLTGFYLGYMSFTRPSPPFPYYGRSGQNYAKKNLLSIVDYFSKGQILPLSARHSLGFSEGLSQFLKQSILTLGLRQVCRGTKIGGTPSSIHTEIHTGIHTGNSPNPCWDSHITSFLTGSWPSAYRAMYSSLVSSQALSIERKGLIGTVWTMKCIRYPILI